MKESGYFPVFDCIYKMYVSLLSYGHQTTPARRVRVEKEEKSSKSSKEKSEVLNVGVISKNKKEKKTTKLFYTSFIPYFSTQTFYQ